MDADSLLWGALRAVGRAVLWLLDAVILLWPWDAPGDDSYRARRRRRILAALTLAAALGGIAFVALTYA